MPMLAFVPTRTVVATSSIAGLPPVVVPDPVQLIPVASETTLRAGDLLGTPVSPTLTAGLDLVLAGSLANNGRAVGYLVSATSPAPALAAVLLTGGTGAIIDPVQAAWIDQAQGTFQVVVPGAMTAGFDAGQYRLRMTVRAGGTTVLAVDSPLLVNANPTLTLTGGQAWCSYAEMLRYSSVIRSLPQSKTPDTAGYGEIRAAQTALVARELVLRYDPMSGFVRVRQLVPDQFFGYDVPSAGAVAPAPAQYASALRSGGLILEEAIRMIVARRSVAEVLDRQSASGSKSYDADATAQRQMADDELERYSPQVDTNGDGVADYLVSPSGKIVTLLPAGTAP